jgi:N-methylhydantoinase B/oxoprolinase/acetone carboxylase alpha subunit
MRSSRRVDAVLVEIVRSYLTAATREMAWAFDRTVFDPTITEIKDYSLGLFNTDLQIVAESLGIPPFSGTLGGGIKTLVDAIGIDNLQEEMYFVIILERGAGQRCYYCGPIFNNHEIVGYFCRESSSDRFAAEGS